MSRRSASLTAVVAVSVLAAACGSDDTDSDSAEPIETETIATDAADEPAAAASGIRVVSASDAAATLADPPDDLVILDVRTPEEFAEGHLEGAVMVDFYEADFADQIAALDRDVPYVIYCRSGNRSGQTRELMAELGFDAVDDVEGGVISWAEAGLPFVITE